MVLYYAKNGSLRNYLDNNRKLNWDSKIDQLYNVIHGLKCIHEKNLIHRDLHIRNILKLKYNTVITDMGLCKPADYNTLENTKSVYGVLPYIAPEILNGQMYTKAADIYSFGIIMYEVISGLPPYYDIKREEDLARRICFGLRPRFNIKVPQLIIHLIKRCLDANSLNRPKTEEIEEILKSWLKAIREIHEFDNYSEIQKQIEEAEKVNNLLTSNAFSINLDETHSKAIYTSRLLNFNNLPEPRNSDDYYEQDYNIISKEFSGIYLFKEYRDLL
jgi:serine/threonine protein kinase